MTQTMRFGALMIGGAALVSTTVASAEPPPAMYALAPPGTADVAKGPLAPVRAEAAPPRALEPTRIHSPALTAGGAVLGTVGIASLAGGLAVLGIDSQQSSHSGPQNPDSFPDLSAIIYVPLIIHGVACIAGGAAMVAVGLKRVPNEPGHATTTAALPAWLPAVAPGPRSVALHWTF